jgi:hypothetical protein
MNCQPSFRTGGVPVAGPALDGLGGPPRRRVPDCDIVDVGPSPPAARPDDPVDVADLAFEPTSGAAGVPAGPPNRRSYMKALLTLLILQIAVAGGLHLRKRLAEAQVIVVPATTDERVVIT